jgi:ADP-L-glycero-D-manno-heptose 6-epimerase
MKKLKKAGFKEEFHTLEDGVKDYVQNHLVKENSYL